jgi:hypothetical protein
MPKLADMDTTKIGGSNFNFSSIKIEHLGATEYSLVTIAVDVTGSVRDFADLLREMLITVVKACKKSPRAENMLIRVIRFSSMFQNGVDEIHGFKLFKDIDPDKDYPELHGGGMTPLCDACFSCFGAMNEYGKKLVDNDYLVNAIMFVITDGEENASTATMKMVHDEAKKGVSGEILESTTSVLIGINAGNFKDSLNIFQKEAGMMQYVDAGDATEGKLAKLAGYISQSVSSTSQALGTGGPSQNIQATI